MGNLDNLIQIQNIVETLSQVAPAALEQIKQKYSKKGVPDELFVRGKIAGDGDEHSVRTASPDMILMAGVELTHHTLVKLLPEMDSMRKAILQKLLLADKISFFGVLVTFLASGTCATVITMVAGKNEWTQASAWLACAAAFSTLIADKITKGALPLENRLDVYTQVGQIIAKTQRIQLKLQPIEQSGLPDGQQKEVQVLLEEAHNIVFDYQVLRPKAGLS